LHVRLRAHLTIGNDPLRTFARSNTFFIFPEHTNVALRLSQKFHQENVMRTFGLILACSCMIALAPGASAAVTAIEPVHPERERLPPSIQRELVLADLEHVLSGPASPTSIATTPYLSVREGLCRRDVIYLR
jgi:hypothetical protein